MFRRPPANDSPPPRRGRRFLYGFFGVLLLLAVGVAVAPMIVARTELRNNIVRDIFSDLDGTINTGSASMGWFSPVVLFDVELRDRQGRVLLFAPRLESKKNLIDLLRDTDAPGCFFCKNAELHIVQTGKITNAEQVFARWLEPGDSDSIDGIGVELDVTESTVDFHDADLDRRWRMDDVAVNLSLPRWWTTPMTVRVRGQLAETGQQSAAASIAAEFDYGVRAEAGKYVSVGRAAADLDQAPARFAETFLNRFDTRLTLAGLLGGKAECKWDDASVHYEGDLAASNLLVTDGPLGRDRLELKRLALPFKIDNRGQRWDIASAKLDCDLGSASAAGVVDLGPGMLAALKQARGEITGNIDIAKLAAQLPRTLHLQQGLDVKSGKIELALASKPADKDLVWTGSLKTSALLAEVNGMPMTWPEPIRVELAARETAGSLVVDRLQCQADFLKLDASGTPTHLKAKASFDLDRLMMAATRFVDVGNLICTGSGELTLDLAQDAGAFKGNATCKLSKFGLTGLSMRPWNEPELSARVELNGALVGASYRLDHAHAQINAGPTWAEVKLIEPVDVFKLSKLACTFRARGDLAAWKERVRPWTDLLDDIRLSGASELTGVVHRTPAGYRLDNGFLSINNLNARAGGFVIAEPSAELKLNGSYQAGVVQLERSELRTATASVQAQQVRLQLPAVGPITCTGKATVQGNAQRLQRLLQPTSLTPLTGNVNGKLAWQWTGVPIEFQLDLTGQNLVYGQARDPIWKEPKPHVVCFGRYDSGKDQLLLRRLELKGDVVGCAGQGRIDDLSGVCDLTLTGNVQYDLARVTQYLRPKLGNGVKLVGKESRPFRVTGALVSAAPTPARRSTTSVRSRNRPPRVVLGRPTSVSQPTSAAARPLRAEATLGLQSAEVYGFQFGALTAKAKYADNWVRCEPITGALNQGKLNVQPSLQVEPMVLNLTRGRVLDRVRITPQMCAGGLGYIAPALANSVQAQGLFSVDLDRARVPFDNVNASDVAGRLSVHQLEARSSPLITEIGTLLGLPGTAQVKPNSVVNFKVANGRVYHDQLELLFGSVVVKTTGSVGLDGSLSLTASMPIPKRWLPPGPAGNALANRTITIPIRGSVDRPKLDEKALREESKKFLRETGKDLLRDEVENGIRRLLGR